MQLVRSLENYQNHEGVVATIGNFDGVHLGHQMIIESIINKSKLHNIPSMVIAFEPSPKEFFLKEDAPARLTTFREKFTIIKNFGVEKFVCLKFNQALASMPAEKFIVDILVKTLNIRSLTVGDNFRFGKNRAGDFKLLQSLSSKLQYEVEDSDSCIYEQQRVSSTLVRELLASNKIGKAEAILGRPYSITGNVVHGDKNGRKINFPTANVPLKRIKTALSGVFAVEVELENENKLEGVANIGTRPTVGGVRTQLEVHIFNFSDEIYGKLIKVCFRKKIREEQKFDSFDELKLQIQKDVQQAHEFFDKK